jgi:Mn2+/Fe2+ NRAMP family transporter
MEEALAEDIQLMEVKHRYAPSVAGEPSASKGIPWTTQVMGRLLWPVRKVRRLPFWAYLAVLGPGIVSAAAGNDAGGIATYAQAGAAYGYSLLWAMLVVTVGLVLVQEMCARMGAVTGKGLSDLIREEFGAGWALLAITVLLVANTGVIVSEFVGIAAAAGLFGIPGWLVVPPIAVLIWWMVTNGSYRSVERVFMLLSLVFVTYVLAAFLAKPDWREVGESLFSPGISFDPAYIQALVAIIGTTITPYMQLFVQASVVEKGVTTRDYKYTRFDTVVGVILSNAVSIFIIIATAATLHVTGTTNIEGAADAAAALEPVAGPAASLLFALGLFGASMLAAGVLPLATAFSVTEALGFEMVVSMIFREEVVFIVFFSFLV